MVPVLLGLILMQLSEKIHCSENDTRSSKCNKKSVNDH